MKSMDRVLRGIIRCLGLFRVVLGLGLLVYISFLFES